MIHSKLHCYIDGSRVIQINKRRARKLYQDGHMVYMHPCRLRLTAIGFRPFDANPPAEPSCRNFDFLVNSFEYYNCQTATGRYSHFFITAELAESLKRNQP